MSNQDMASKPGQSNIARGSPGEGREMRGCGYLKIGLFTLPRPGDLRPEGECHEEFLYP